MSNKRKKQKQVRADPVKQSWLCSDIAYETLCVSGYTRLSDNPEIKAAVNKICDLISSMTIYLMENRDNGDYRIKNELSRRIDISPNGSMTRKTWMSCIVRTLLLEGDGNAVVYPTYSGDYLDRLIPLSPYSISYVPDGHDYYMIYNNLRLDPEQVLHFVINPDPVFPYIGTGYRTTLKDIAQNLKQATATKKGFMESKWKPSVIVKVDSMSEELSNPEGRRKILDSYVASGEAGEPWIIPAEQFDVEVVKPLSLHDIAISDSVLMDKKTVASILDVPAFIVGAGAYNEAEWNHFIKARIGPLSDVIAQEFTSKLLISPNWYFKLNVRSLMAYDIEKLSRVGDDNYTRGIMTGNEVRDWLNLSPMEGLDELIILENYIPQGMIGDQNKLKGGEE